MKYKLIIGLIFFLIFYNIAIKGSDWPLFLQNQKRTGVSFYTSPEPPGLLKESEIGVTISSSPILDDNGNIYIGTLLKTDENWTRGYLKAFNQNGDLLWQLPIEGEIDSTPAYFNGKIIFGAFNGIIYCVNVQGEILWQYDTKSSIRRCSPVFDSEGNFYLGDLQGKFYSFTQNGSLRWIYDTKAPIFSSPSINSENIIFFGNDAGKVYALNLSGEVQSSFDAGSSVRSAVAIDENDNIYFGSLDGTVFALDKEENLLWSKQTNGAIDFSSPAIHPDGYICIGNEVGFFVLFKDSGEIKWSIRTGAPFRGSPAIGTNGTIIIGSNDGKIYGFDPEGFIRWQIDTGSPVLSSPAIINESKIIIAGLSNKLYIYTQATPTPTPTFTMTPSPTPSPTNTFTPTATPTSRFAPIIYVAGYMYTKLTPEKGGKLNMIAYAADPDENDYVENVEIYYDGKPMGVFLEKDPNIRGLFRLKDIEVGPLMQGYYPLELVATDNTGMKSSIWPYLKIYPYNSQTFKSKENIKLIKLPEYFNEFKQANYNDNAPIILYGGFYDTQLVEGRTSKLTIIAGVDDPQGLGDISRVEVYFNYQPTGLTLNDKAENGDLKSGDGLFTFSTEIEIPIGTAGTYELQIFAFDTQGNRSNPWPFLAVIK